MIDGVEFDKTLPYQIESMSFEKWDNSFDDEIFSFFLDAILQCNLKNTLKKINLHDCDVDWDVVSEQVFGLRLDIDLQFDHIFLNKVQVSASKIFYD